MDLLKLRSQKCTAITKSYSNFNGYELPSTYETIAEDIENFEVYDDDVWVLSFPKSGTTWTMEMVWLVTHDVDIKKATEENVFYRVIQVEYEGIFGKIANSEELIKGLKRPRCFKSHLPWDLLPKQIRNFERKPKIVHVSRDARDVCVSYYHHTKKAYQKYTTTFDEFCELFMAGLVPFSPYYRYLKSFEHLKDLPNMLMLDYEKLITDLPSELKRMGRFFEIDLTESQVNAIIKHTKLEKMRENESVHVPKRIAKSWDYDPKVFYRKGIIGDYKNEFSAEMIEKFEKFMAENA